MEKPEIQRAINEAIACFNSGRVERAEEIYREVVAEAPTAGNYADLGLICGKQGKHDEAVLLLRRAVDLQPESADFHFKLGRTYQRRGSIDDTIRSWQRTIELDPDHVDALSELGSVYLRGRETERSLAFFRKVLEIDPQHYYAHNNLGIAYARQGRMREAIDFHKRAIALRPDYPLAYDSLGSACAMSLRVDDAIASHERAIELEPENGSFHWNYASALLLAGRYDQGWQEYEWRWRTPELGKRKAVYPAPEWHGEDISGKTVVLYGEQGYGDVIQFIRYASSIARRGGTVLVVTQPDLARLLAGASGVSGAICAGDPLGHLDFHFPLLSLPSLFRTTLDTIPSDVPYLRANEALVQAWRARTAGTKALRVGLIWAGKLSFTYDHLRSCALADFAGLSRIGGVQLYSLQKGEPAAQAKSPPAGMTLIDWTDELGDFADTAALMQNLDLIISVDTAGAHLAGALGKPVWLLNRYQTEWRWMLDREDSPWYPTMRIFRQPEPGDWKSVMARVAAELEKLVASRKDGLAHEKIFRL